MATETLRNNPQDPIAIIGIGCRFPGGIKSPQSFWEFLAEGRDGISEVPPDRWDINSYYDQDREKTGKLYTRKGGFLDNITDFDPQFFGISPREAAFLDPQQRLLLEVTWEALEDGGLVPENLRGTNVGVFVGVFMHDYENIHCQVSERRLHGSHSATGMSTTIAANRLSYIFDFKGPSLVVDTACSSSLVAVHLACRSILNNESSIAVAGGVNMLIRPEMTMVLCKGSFLSPDGYCKSFDARANGYTRAEGAGIVVLKRLSHAIRDDDPIYAVIKGSAVNQDGRSDGITVPTVDSQVKVIHEALSRAGRTPESIQYVEAHGTGTAVGDPIESRAIATALTRNRNGNDFCIIGSVKSNIGHTESAAGAAGLIKAALMLKHGMITPNLHFETPNPNIPFNDFKLRVPTSLEQWPEAHVGLTRIAGVNSFGFGGTNAHAVLESFPGNSREDNTFAGAQSSDNKTLSLMPLSARSPEALAALAKMSVEFLASEEMNDLSLQDFGYTRALRRGHHPYRLAIAARSKDELTDHLNAYIDGERRSGLSVGQLKQKGPSKLAFVFSGMGQQWQGMGQALYEKEPVFRDSVDRCAAVFSTFTDDWSLTNELYANPQQSRFGETRIIQPCIFAVQTALVALLRSRGIQPDTVVGHSVGEIAAAHAAGILTLEDAARISYHRSRLQQSKAGQGAMLAVGMNIDDTETLLRETPGNVSIAAVNSPANITLSGDREPLDEIAARLEKDNVFARFLNVDVAFHSAAMDSILDEFRESLAGVEPRKGNVDFVSTVTGKIANWQEITPEYWLRNVRESVLFADALQELIGSGNDLFLEIGAHPVLANSMQDCLARAGSPSDVVLPTLRRNERDDVMFYGSLGRLYTSGYPVDWHKLYPNGGKLVKLPSYPWQREYYWLETEESKSARLGKTLSVGTSMLGQQVHPLLGSRLNAAVPTWNAEIDSRHPSYLADHVVQKSVVYPAAAYIETANAVAAELNPDSAFELFDIEIKGPLLLSEDESVTVQCIVNANNSFSIYSNTTKTGQSWNLHAVGKIEYPGKNNAALFVSLDEIRNRITDEVERNTCYQRFRSLELEYGPRFQGIERIWIKGDEALGKITVSEIPTTEIAEYHIHPVVLDACFQVMASINTKETFLPVKFKRVRLYGRPNGNVWCHSYLTEKGTTIIRGNLQLFDDSGLFLADITGLSCRRVERAQDSSQDSIENLRYEYRWILDDHSADMNRRRGVDYLPSPNTIADSLGGHVETLAGLYERDTFNTIVMPELYVQSSKYIVHALMKLGWTFDDSGTFTADSLADTLRIVPEHRHLFRRMIEILVEDGILIQDGDSFHCIGQPPADDPADGWRKLIRKYPAFHAELSLLHRCGSWLAEVLRGEDDPLSLIFPANSLLTEHLYYDAPSFRYYNRLMQLVMRTIVESVPEGQPLRILEIGAGTGAMASQLLPVLPTHRTRYVFTDISKAFTAQAEQKFRSLSSCVDFTALDIEKDPIEQGFQPHAFDIVIASDVLHATADLNKTLINIKRLLAHGGLLLVLEITTPHRWFDLVFGMLSGWWLFSDHDIRPNNPLMSKSGWLTLLSSLGFSDTQAIPSREGWNESQHSILIARKSVGDDITSNTVDTISPESAAIDERLTGRPWLIISEESDVGSRIARQLKEKGISPVVVARGDRFEILDRDKVVVRPEHSEDMELLIDAVCHDTTVSPVIVDVAGFDDTGEIVSSGYLEKITNTECSRQLTLIQTIMRREWTSPPDFWLVTGNVESLKNARDTSLAYSPLWGIARVMASEFANLQTRMIDISSKPSDTEITALCGKLLSPDSEDELMIRGKNRYIRRLIRRHEEQGVVNAPPVPCRLHPSNTKGFDTLSFHEYSRTKPGPGEVEIEVRAAGLNFKDVAKTAGLLDTTVLADKERFDSLGMECSGVISAVGEGVDRFAVGDEIMGVVHDGFSRYTTIDPKALVRKPGFLSFEEAATIPLVFLASFYALKELAGIKKGDRVLIHSAAGGIGLSAIQIAQSVGAEIYATAGTPEKQDYLKALGITYVGDSRSMAFIDEILEATDNSGVDIVLNTLPAKTISGSMSLLKPVTGRFIDISNMYEPSLTISSLAKGVSFHSFDLESVVNNQPDMVRSLWDSLLGGFTAGIYHPLPYRAFPMSAIASAFRYMKKGMHIGKIVITMKDADIVPTPTSEFMNVHEDGTYLITGGLGGFGLAVAQWLVDCGARHLVLWGRRGATTPEAQAAVRNLSQTGAQVVVERVDVTDEAQVREHIDSIEKTMPQLKGIIHAAMVLNDSPLMSMTAEQMKKVLDPKILGAWNLHSSSLNMNLDFFICFSSIASLIGNSDQGNYVAANYFLESLVRYRKACGLPALAINWGPIAGAGYVAEHDEIRDHLKRQGVSEIPLKLAWQAIAHSHEKNLTQVGLLTADWNIVYRYSLSVSKSPRFSLLVHGQENIEDTKENNRIGISQNLSPEERKELLSQSIAREVAAVLGISSSKLDAAKPLDALGIDSLMAVELVVGIETATGVSLPKMVLLRPGLTVDELVVIVEKELLKRHQSTPIDVGQDQIKDIATPAGDGIHKDVPVIQSLNVDSMSDDEIDSMLNSLISGGHND